jgi:predicted transcriptional regulator
MAERTGDRDSADVSEAEFAVMQVLWDAPGPGASIRQIAEAIFGKKASSRYPTVQKQLERLEAKGFVRRDRTLMVHLFSAAVAREELVGRRLDALVQKVCGGSLAPVLNHLLRAPKLTAGERAALREMIEKTEPPGKSAKEE